jgi:hypothetical protein
MRCALVVAALAGAGCGFFDAGPPDRSCRADRDCFRAQGETCNQETQQCEVPVDAGIDAAPPIDAEIDATIAPIEAATIAPTAPTAPTEAAPTAPTEAAPIAPTGAAP